VLGEYDISEVWRGLLMKSRVNAVAPGPVDTVQFRKECQENPEQLYLDAQATYVKAIPRKSIC
jgi:hypothetical protein